MSAPPADSPIQRLDFDILSHIIKMNANMFKDDKALETTLITSRVCHDWRSFMLGTSSIWARLIDLGRLYGRTAKWRRELFRRSGTALLWIKTQVDPDWNVSPPYTNYVLNILSEHWERIQKLEISVAVGREDQWIQLCVPAPHLEFFGITLLEWKTHDDGRLFSSLFGGSAPMLRELRYKGYRVNFTAPWQHQLRSMELDSELTVSETLGILMLTENLVELQIDHTVADHTPSTLPFVALPKLAHLVLKFCTVDPNPGAVLRDHMYIPPACSLAFVAHSIQPEDIASKSTLESFMRVISTFARRHFTHNVPQQLMVVFVHFGLMISTPTFRFYMGLTSVYAFPEHTLPIFLSNFTLSDFSQVTVFGLFISGMDHPVPELTAFVACLPSINVVETDKWSLRHLIRAQVALEPKIMFPELNILTLAHPFRPFNYADAPDPVSEFVMARIAHGHATGTIDLTAEALDVLPDMAYLRKADGLKVRWRQRGVAKILEYICGTGAPRNLVAV